jgi:hypothetical protein
MKKKMLLITGILFIITFSLSAYSKKKSKPKWLKNPKSVYNPQLYLTAIGEGDTRSDAENSAIGSISKIFESKVNVDETTKEEYRELLKNDKAEASTSTQIDKNIKLNSSQTLFNIQFGESYTDELGRTYVIAFLDRMKTADIYLDKLEKNSNKINQYLKLEKMRTDPIKKYSYLKSALVVAKWNEVLLSQLDIISPSMKDFNEKNYDIVKIKNEFNNVAKAIKFNIKIHSKNADQVSEFISSLINKCGFSITNEASDFLISGTAKIEKMDLQRKQKFVHWDIFLKVLNKGNVIFSFQKSGREGHISYEQATNRALREIDKKLKRNFYKELMNHITKYSEN